MTNIAMVSITMLLMGKLTISMVIFSSYVSQYQRVHWLLQFLGKLGVVMI